MDDDILEPHSIPEIWIDGAGNFQLENGILRFVPFTIQKNGGAKAKVAIHRIICKPDAMIAIGAQTRALFGGRVTDYLHPTMWM